MKEKNLQPRLPYPARIPFRYEGEIKSFIYKQNLKEFSTTKSSLQQKLKDLLQTRNRVKEYRPWLSGNVWREDSYVLSLMSPLSLLKRNSTLLLGTEVIVWGRLGSPLVNILFRTKLLSLVPLSCDMDCLLTLWLTLPLVPLVTVAVHLVFWSLSFPKEVSCTAAYNLIGKSLKHLCFIRA